MELYRAISNADSLAMDPQMKNVKRILKKMNGDFINWKNPQDGGWTALHLVCWTGQIHFVVLLLKQPGIDVCTKDNNGRSAFWMACSRGHSRIVGIMCNDDRVNVNEVMPNGYTPLSLAASCGHLNCIALMIASKRYLHLGVDGTNSDPINETNRIDRFVTDEWQDQIDSCGVLLKRFKKNPKETRRLIRIELGVCDEISSDLFALIVFVCDGYLTLPVTGSPTKKQKQAARFFKMTQRLPMELQMVVCYRYAQGMKNNITSVLAETAMKKLVKNLL